MYQVSMDRGIKAAVLALALSAVAACASGSSMVDPLAEDSPDGGFAAADASSPTRSDAVSQSNGNHGNQSGITAVGPAVTLTLSQINSAATTAKKFSEANHALPSDVAINNTKVTMPQFLQLLAEDVVQTNAGSTAPIVLEKVDAPENPTETVQAGTLTKAEYLSLAETVKAQIKSTGKAPAAANTALGQLRFESLVYVLSKVMSFYEANQRLPNSLSVAPWSSGTTSTSSAVLDAIGQEEARFKDVQGISDVASFVRLGHGDCWADSMWLYSKLTAAGVQARIMGYVGRGSGTGYRHAWIEINTGHGWQTWDYKRYNSQHYGDCCTGTPFVLIGPGNPHPDILSTGY